MSKPDNVPSGFRNPKPGTDSLTPHNRVPRAWTSPSNSPLGAGAGDAVVSVPGSAVVAVPESVVAVPPVVVVVVSAAWVQAESANRSAVVIKRSGFFI
jgi:hypothetical protein